MSLRIPLRRLVAPLRALSTTSRVANAPAQSAAPQEAGSSSSSTAGQSAFNDLNALLSGTPGTPELAQAVESLYPVAASSSGETGPTLVDPNARRGYTPHAVPPDTHPLLDLFTNLLMKHGRKAEAQARVSRLLSLIQGATNANPVPLLSRAVSLSSPSIRVVSSRARAKTVQTPLALTERQRTRQGIMWILKAAEKGRKGGVPRETRIAREVLAVLEGNSDVFKWLEEKHKVATANRSNLNTRR